jgi:PAS domain S-box-containing protein
MTGALKPPRPAVFRACAQGAAVGSIVLALVVLGGWALDVAWPKTLIHGTPAMKPNTAVALALLGAALWALLPQRAGPWRRALGRAFAAGALLLGAATLLEHLSGRGFGVDAFLFQWTQWAQRTPPPRPSINTSVCLVLLGAALLLLERWPRPRVPWADVLVVPVLLSALLVSNAYLHGSLAHADAPELFAHTGVGLLTALLLLTLSMGILCARPDRGLLSRLAQGSIGGLLARRLVPLALVGPPLMSAVLRQLAAHDVFGPEAKMPLFSTLASVGGVAFVLLSAWRLDLLDAERRRASAALKASEAHLRGLLETAPDPVVIVDRDGLLRFVNSEAERLFGYRREELLGQPVEVLLPEHLREEHLQHREAYGRAPVVRRMGHGGLTLLARRKDGSEFNVELSLSPTSSPEGLTVTAILRDATERERFLSSVQRAREEAEEQRARLQTVLNETPVGILVVDPATGTLFANAALQALFGRQLLPDAGRGQYLQLLRQPDGQPLELDDLPSSRALADKPVSSRELLLMRADGRLVPVLVNAAPVHGPAGEVRSVVVTVMDISAQRELERLREEYVGLVSHDLRNPLSNIALRVQLLERALRSKGLTRELAIAEALQQSARRMNGMIEELLESTRLESGRVELHREPMDLAHFLEGVLERDVPPDERERFTLEVSGPVPPVSVDAARLERVVVNLLGNALKYTPPRTPVTVRLASEGGRAVVSVKDAGPGLRPEEQAQLFEKYYRTRSGRKAEGTGLGLYISRLIIGAHGGRIWVESTPGGGSTFSFTLPLEAAGAPEAARLGPQPGL